MTENRRPIKARSAGWATGITAALLEKDISPNQISMASVVFALSGVAALMLNSGVVGLILCALAIQLRLLCNLLDGMVAIEGRKQSRLGDLYNEFPDRIADSVLIVGVGYAISYSDLGWCGALAAALTAYVRVFWRVDWPQTVFFRPHGQTTPHGPDDLSPPDQCRRNSRFWHTQGAADRFGHHHYRLADHLRHANPRNRQTAKGKRPCGSVTR